MVVPLWQHQCRQISGSHRTASADSLFTDRHRLMRLMIWTSTTVAAP
jgi:hypothetical protein